MPILAKCIRKSITFSCSSMSIMPICMRGRVYIPFTICSLGLSLYSPFCSPALTEGDCCTQGRLRPFPWWELSWDILFRDFGVPISPNGFCRLIIRWGFPKVASDLITRQIYGCGLDLQKNNLQKFCLYRCILNIIWNFLWSSWPGPKSQLESLLFFPLT